MHLLKLNNGKTIDLIKEHCPPQAFLYDYPGVNYEPWYKSQGSSYRRFYTLGANGVINYIAMEVKGI